MCGFNWCGVLCYRFIFRRIHRVIAVYSGMLSSLFFLLFLFNPSLYAMNGSKEMAYWRVYHWTSYRTSRITFWMEFILAKLPIFSKIYHLTFLNPNPVACDLWFSIRWFYILNSQDHHLCHTNDIINNNSHSTCRNEEWILATKLLRVSAENTEKLTILFPNRNCKVHRIGMTCYIFAKIKLLY